MLYIVEELLEQLEIFLVLYLKQKRVKKIIEDETSS